MRLLCARIGSIEKHDAPTMREAFGNERKLASRIVGALRFSMAPMRAHSRRIVRPPKRWFSGH